MALKILAVAVSMIAAAPTTAAGEVRNAGRGAPPGTSETRYCMRVEAVTGSRVETVRCWTRTEWAHQGVDVDEDWPEEGIRVVA